MSSLRKVKAWALGHELNPDTIRNQLSTLAVPVSTADCRTCSDPCEDGHADYPTKWFAVDMETQMLGSVRPFRRQILISTGKTDWDREITRTSGSLAAHISRTGGKTGIAPSATSHSNGPPPARISGISNSSDSSELSILNASHNSISEEDDLETVLVFPDFMVVADVPSSVEGAQLMWETMLPPRILGSGQGNFKTWVLPYSCVITFCSHKQRDHRCGITAPKLELEFTGSLERRGWTVDTQLEHIVDPPLEKFSGTADQKEAHITQTLKVLPTAKKALILYNSHMGGHRYAGNCIIYTPSGSSVWYGRVTPHEVDSIVENTIEGGLVLPPLLRGGLNLSKPGRRTLHDW
ncbi:Sucrase/ferredoxin-like-domain-containing protein [Mycena vulgaris]|nr:Sucrase/ferredoxin-like-domain-containing protein [Mycena vulgaris]